jgi:hypothetical protein
LALSRVLSRLKPTLPLRNRRSRPIGCSPTTGKPVVW